MMEIKVWAQMFFDDGSVSQGIRVDAEILESDEEVDKIAGRLLNSLNRNAGFMLIWGAGNIVFLRYPRATSSSKESDSSV